MKRIVVIVALLAVPLGVLGWLSFGAWGRLFSTGVPFASGLWTTATLAFGSAVAATSLGTGTARWVQGHKWRSFWLASAWLPFALSPVIVGILLLAVHLKTGLAGSWSGVFLSHLVFAYAFAFILMEGFWRRDMHALEQLARTLGARGWPLWRQAMLPALARPVALVLVQTFLISWFQYGLTLLVGSGRIQTLPLLVFGFVREADVYLAAAAGLLLVIVPLVMLAWTHDR
ncbi:MAG: hypothetical protein RIE53_12480 [Rhodothermales bacterium]